MPPVSADMRHFQEETEQNLNKTIETLKRQMDDEEREKKAMTQDKQALQSVATSLDETNQELKSQVTVCKAVCKTGATGISIEGRGGEVRKDGGEP